MFARLLPWKRGGQDLRRADRWIFGTMLAFGAIGLLSAFVLTVERIHLLQNPDASLSCNFNLVLNCATVMKTWQASLFGFPNPIIGLMGYSVVVTVAMAGLAGVRFPRPFLIAAQIGYGLGLIFAYWLFFQSVYVIEVLCPWCLIVTFSTTLIFETLLRYNLRENTFGLSKKAHATVLQFLKADYDKLLVAGWLLLMVILVLAKFREGLL
ncbi:vitamin K epoxide reductase family protein [Candidatus Saccharibacteria bacterium]|nr:vitamin K epoxide reductase family protein [Candidatus Saccharibacteria bacterium]